MTITNRTEHAEQVELMRLVKMSESKYPALKLMFACPNGSLRHRTVAAKLKAGRKTWRARPHAPCAARWLYGPRHRNEVDDRLRIPRAKGLDRSPSIEWLACRGLPRPRGGLEGCPRIPGGSMSKAALGSADRRPDARGTGRGEAMAPGKGADRQGPRTPSGAKPTGRESASYASLEETIATLPAEIAAAQQFLAASRREKKRRDRHAR